MGLPRFEARTNDLTPLPGSVITLDIYSSEPLENSGPPSVRVAGIRPATFLTQENDRYWKFEYTVSALDTGALIVEGTSASTLELGSSYISSVFSVKYSGEPESPFSQYPFGYSYVGSGLPLPEPIQPVVLHKSQFSFDTRRGFEGPQVVATWNNPFTQYTFDIQSNVLSFKLTTTVPGGPGSGDRYIVSPDEDWTGTLWEDQENTIAEWDGAAWGFEVPTELMLTQVDDESANQVFRGTHPFGGWVLETDLARTVNVKLLRKELEYATDDTDADATLLLGSDATSFSDIYVVDGRWYYYSLFAELRPIIDPGVYSLVGTEATLAIDNQPYVDWIRQGAVISAITVAQPTSGLTAGDKYVVPVGATGANWTGNDGRFAEWNGASWEFTDTSNLWFVTATADDAAYTKRLGLWTEVIDKKRIDFYQYLNDYDRKEDLQTEMKAFSPSIDTRLDGEQFNFDMDSTIQRTQMVRFLKNFNLPFNEVQGLSAEIRDFYDPKTTLVDMLPQVASMIGFDEFLELPVPTRRFLVEAISGVWPRVGVTDLVGKSIPIWVGTGETYTIHNYVDNLWISNGGICPDLSGGLPDYGGPSEASHRLMHLNWAGLYHQRGMVIFFDNPVDPKTFLVQTEVTSRLTTPPGSPAEGDRHLIIATATGAWAGQEDKIAEWDGASWVFTTPLDRYAVYVTADEQTRVYRGTFATGSWDTALDPTDLLRLEWWLRDIVLPGSVFFTFVETP
jgi:hypothetical protein